MSKVTRQWESQKETFMLTAISHKSTFITSLRKVGPEELFMFVGSFQRWLLLLALDYTHAQNMRGSNGAKQCQTPLKKISQLQDTSQCLPKERESTKLPHIFQNCSHVTFSVKVIANPQQQLMVSIALCMFLCLIVKFILIACLSSLLDFDLPEEADLVLCSLLTPNT